MYEEITGYTLSLHRLTTRLNYEVIRRQEGSVKYAEGMERPEIATLLGTGRQIAFR